MRTIFDKISPATGKRSVLIERDELMDDNLEVCMETGYQTYTKAFEAKGPHINDVEKVLPDTIVNSRLSDSDNFWYKLPIPVGEYMIHPNLRENHDIHSSWYVSKLVEEPPTKDSFKIPIQDQDTGQIIDWAYIDDNTTIEFDQEPEYDDHDDLINSSFNEAYKYAYSLLNNTQQAEA